MSVAQDLLKRLPDGVAPGWDLLVDGVLIPMREMSLIHPKFGEVRFGLSPAGKYGTWGFAEVGGGGAVDVPFFMHPELGLMVGLVQQPRPFMSTEPVWNLPRGFMDPGETHFESAVRELKEEVGAKGGKRVFLLDGDPVNPNSTFFVTVGKNDDGTDKGIRFYGVRFQPEDFQPTSDGFVFKPGVVEPVSKAAEGIMKCRFIPWLGATNIGCLMTVGGICRLIAYLNSHP